MGGKKVYSVDGWKAWAVLIVFFVGCVAIGVLLHWLRTR